MHPMRSLAWLWLGSLVLACAQPSERHGEDHPAAHPQGAKLAPVSVGGLRGVQLFGDVYLAGQPSTDDLAAFAARGVRTVVNLRREDEKTSFDERARAEALGLEYVSLPWNGAEELTDDVFDGARELLDEADRPLLLHCGSGNRVGALWIPWRVLDGGLGLESAVAEAKAIGLKTPEYEAKAREYVARNLRH